MNKKFYFLLIFLGIILLLVFSAFGYYQYKNESSSNIEFAKNTDKALIKIDKANSEQKLESVFTDLRLLENLPAMREFIAKNSPENKKGVQNLFSEISAGRKIYDQVRYLDMKGQEIIRVDYKNGSTIVVKDSQLQNKADRYYFTESIVLNDGDIYISPLDLNIEQNKIEEPWKPMIRIASPIFYNNQKMGIVVLNYLAEGVLQELQKDTSINSRYGEAELVDRRGYWLNSNNKENEWGFMFPEKKDLTLAKLRPEIWQKISETTEGQFLLEDGLYTFSTIVPVVGFDYSWKIYRFTPREIIFLGSNLVMKELIIIGIVSLLLILTIIVSVVFILNRKIREMYLIKKYKNIFDSSFDAIMTINSSDFKFSDGNKATLKIFGLKNINELKNFTLSDLSPEKQPNGKLSSELIKEMINLVIKNDSNSFECNFKRLDGPEFIAQVSLSKIDNYNNLQVIIRDITKEKTAFDRVMKSEAETKRVLNETERMNKIMVGRELEMIKLKKEISSKMA